MIDFDIYALDANLSPLLVQEAKNWKARGDSEGTLADALYRKLQTTKEPAVGVSMTLNFVKSVTTSQVVEAFNDAFSTCDPALTKQFKDTLHLAVGDHGMKVGEVVEFTWLTGGGLVISSRGKTEGVFFGVDIEKRLLEVYLDPKISVSPSLLKSIDGFLA